MIGTKSGRARARWLVKLGLGIVMLAFFMAVPEWVEAQGSGSSFGGGDWGGGGGSDYGGGGGSDYGGGGSDYGGGGGGDYDYGGGGSGYSGSSSYSSGGSGNDMEALFCFLLFTAIFMAWIFYPLLKEDKKRRKPFTPQGGARAWNRVDVTTLQIAVDWRARAALQKKLEQLARSGRTRSKRGLTKLLRETGIHLLRVERSWLYAYVRNYYPAAPPQAQGTFTRRANEARTKYVHELVRSDSGDLVVQDGPDFEKRAVEGEGVVVVTLVVAAKQELLDVHPKDFSDAAQIRHFLQYLTSLPEVTALEVIWSPSAEDDRMSTAELEMVYPKLVKLDEASIAGRVFCKYCSAPFAAELMECPHCGAPVDNPSASENSAQDA